MSKNYLYNLCISLVNILFPIVTFRYAAHLLGPVGIGKVQFAISFAEYFSLFAALGIPVYGIAATAKSGAANLSKVFSELISLHAFSGIVCSVLYFSILFTVPFFKSDLELYQAAGLLVLLGFTSIDWFYFGIEKFKLVALRTVAVKIVAVGLLFVFVRTSTDFINYLWVLLFTILGNNLISLAFINRHTKLAFKGLQLKKHLQPVVFILGSNIAINMYALWDTLILGFLTNSKSVGLYAAGVKLIKFSVPFIISLGASLIPRLTQSIHNNTKEEHEPLLAQSFHFIAFIAVPISVGLFLLAPEFIYFLSGADFEPAIVVMRILSILPVFIGLGHFFSLQIMVPAGLNKELFLATFVAAVLSISLNFLLIPIYNIIGAGIANIAAEFMVTLLFYRYVSMKFKIQVNWYLFLKSLTASIVLIPVVYLARTITDSSVLILGLSIAIGGMLYVLIQHLFFKDKLIFFLSSKIGLFKKSAKSSLI